MVGNAYRDRSVIPQCYVNTADAILVRQLDVQSGGCLIGVPTLGEILAAGGRRLAVLSTNYAGTTRLFHHKAEDFGDIRLSGYFREACTPADVLKTVEARIGPLPAIPPHDEPDRAGQHWITSAFLDVVWPDHQPDVTILSYGEPDNASHYHGTAAAATRDIIAYCDREFGRVLDWWEFEGRAVGVELLVISDHGHITGHTRVSVLDSLRDAGFKPGPAPAPDVDVIVVPGQVGGLYLTDPRDSQISRAVAAITGEPWCGPVFTRGKDDTFGVAPGSLGRHLVFADHARAPDVSFSFRANDDIDAFGLVGGAFFTGNGAPGCGVHGGLHRNEMAAVGMVAGAAFAGRGMVSTMPSGICDFAPTILHLLGVTPPADMTGRVLHEVLATRNMSAPDIRHETIEARLGDYRQYLYRVHVGDTVYVDSGVAEGLSS